MGPKKWTPIPYNNTTPILPLRMNEAVLKSPKLKIIKFRVYRNVRQPYTRMVTMALKVTNMLSPFKMLTTTLEADPKHPRTGRKDPYSEKVM